MIEIAQLQVEIENNTHKHMQTKLTIQFIMHSYERLVSTS